MSNERCETLYSEIANKANEIVPVKWSRILLNAECQPGVVTSYYCFYEAETGELIKFSSIPEIYRVDKNEVKYARLELTELISRLYEEWNNTDEEKWTTMTFILESDGEFKIDFGYENLEETDVLIRRQQWEKKYVYSNSLN